MRDTVTVARDLLGMRLVRKSADGTLTAGLIVETEAYCGYRDAACHSYKGKTQRTRLMFEAKGHAYVYLIYGMYCCMNITSGPPGEPEAVLIRALEPVEGIDLMGQRRKREKLRELCSGPGKLSIAMDIHKGLYGEDLLKGEALYLETGELTPNITVSKRINIGYAGEAADYLWRFSVTDSPFVSVKPKT